MVKRWASKPKACEVVKNQVKSSNDSNVPTKLIVEI